VDVMYEAVDAQGELYVQPKRDSQEIWAIVFFGFIFFSNMFFLNLSVGVIVEQYLSINKACKMINDIGAQVEEGECSKTGDMHYFCRSPLLERPDSPSAGTSSSPSGSKKASKAPKVLCSPENQCQACLNFTPDPMLTAKQAQWLESRKSLHGRTEPFQLTNLHLKPKLQKKAFLFISTNLFENSIMTAIILNTVLMACQAFPQPTEWWGDFKTAAGYTFAFIFTVEFGVKFFALRRNYWKDSWNIFDICCVIATFVGIILDLVGIGIGAVMSVIRIFRVARLFRLLRFAKGVNKIFMALVYSLPKLANVCVLLALLLILYSILGVQLFAKNKLNASLDLHGNFRTFERAFITLFRAMTGEAWNEMMHDLAKSEKDFLMGPRISEDKSWCSPAYLWDTDSESSYQVLKDKCMIDHPNQCVEYRFVAQLYFISFCLIITFMILNIVIAVILDGYEDGKSHTEGEVIDMCIQMWAKYDPDYTMFIPFPEAFAYSDEVLQKLAENNSENQDLAPPVIRPSPTGCHGIDLACVPMKYAQAFDLQMTEDGQVHFIPVAKLVLRIIHTNNDPELLKEIEETDTKLSKKDQDKLNRMESNQLMKNNAVLKGSFSLQAQVAASKIQRRFKTRQARRRAQEDLDRRFPGNRTSAALYRPGDKEPDAADNIIAESVASTPGTAPEGPSQETIPEAEESAAAGAAISQIPAVVAGDTTEASASSGPAHHLEPRNPANVDGLDEPGRWRMVSVSPAEPEGPEQSNPSGSVQVLVGGNAAEGAERLPSNPPPGG